MKTTLTLISVFVLLFLSLQSVLAQRGVSGSVNPGVVSRQLSSQAQQQRQQIQKKKRKPTIQYKNQNVY